VASGTPDCDGDLVPNSCELDTNNDLVPDDCQDGGTAYCFGVGPAGGGVACPCGNIGAAGSGCPNSQDARGARLDSAALCVAARAAAGPVWGAHWGGSVGAPPRPAPSRGGVAAPAAPALSRRPEGGCRRACGRAS
jgi:hypothetical protein